MLTMTERPSDTGARWSRRSIVLASGGVVLGGAMGATAADEHGDDDDEDRGPPEDDERGRPDESVLQTDRTEAFVWDTDMDAQLSNTIQPAADPTEEGREDVVHATSGGTETSDYAAAGIDLRADELTLQEASEAGAISYDRSVGEGATDEVFCLLETGDDALIVAGRGGGGETTDGWETRDVSSELTADGWRTIELDPEHVDVDDEAVNVELEEIGGYALELQEGEAIADLVDRYGDADLLGMAIGVGALSGAVVDTYVADLRVHDDPRAVPAVVPMDVSFDGPGGDAGGRVTASLTFPENGHDLTAEDVDTETIRLASYAPVAPPLPGSDEATDAATADASVTEQGIDAEFVPGQIYRFAGADQPTPVVLYGDFDVEEPYTFVAIGELQPPGE